MFFTLPMRAKALLYKAFAAMLLTLACTIANAQLPDTFRLTIPAAEKIFLQKNLQLLAAKYNIDANQALIDQAKLWDNPVLSTDQNIYDAAGGFFSHNKTNGQFYIQISQLIRTAGKRNKEAQLAADNTTLSKAQFNELLRTLRSILINDLLQTRFLQETQQVYDLQIMELTKLVKAMDAQLDAGNISLKDLTRLKASLFGLQNEVAAIQIQFIPIQQELKLLLQNNDSSFIKPMLDYSVPSLGTYPLPPLIALVDSAKTYRPDVSIDKTILDYNIHNVALQKALSKPDITAGLAYDQRSNYASHYVGLQLSLPIPLLNRNQGNIKNAQYQVKQQETVFAATQDKIANEVLGALNTVKFYQQLNNKQQLNFSTQYDFLLGNMMKSFQQRQVNMLEFIDFIDNYKDTKLKLLGQYNNLVQSIADLNYTVNKTVIPIN